MSHRLWILWFVCLCERWKSGWYSLADQWIVKERERDLTVYEQWNGAREITTSVLVRTKKISERMLAIAEEVLCKHLRKQALNSFVLSNKFYQVSKITHNNTVEKHLHYQKLCLRMVLKLHKTNHLANALSVLERCFDGVDNLLSPTYPVYDSIA